MTRPAIAELPVREAKPLRVTMRTWRRELARERMHWNVYVPNRGAAILGAVIVPLDTPRDVVAAKLRALRDMLTGRDKRKGMALAKAQADALAKVEEAAPIPVAPVAVAADVRDTLTGQEEPPAKPKRQSRYGPKPEQLGLFG